MIYNRVNSVCMFLSTKQQSIPLKKYERSYKMVHFHSPGSGKYPDFEAFH